MLPPLLGPIFASAGLGALVGLIRQWSEQTEHGGKTDFGGVRTHTFWAILGCLGAVASRDFTPLALPVVITVVAAHLLVAHVRHSDAASPGSTSFAASLLTLFVGALVAWNHTQTAVVVAALTMVLLGLKQTIHDWTRAFTPADIRGTLQFVAITGVILPLVPNRTFGPFDAFNPYSTWLMVVLISGLGFTGYIAMRLFGTRAGILVTSLFGGLASSTASTLAFSRRSREEPELSLEYAFAVVVACTVMLPRIAIIVFLLSPALALRIAPAFGLMMVPALLYAVWQGWVARRAEKGAVASPAMSNPLSLTTAIKFALLYAVIAFLVKATTQLDWQAGLLPLSFVSGLTDMDAISLSMATNTRSEAVSLDLAARAVILAGVANSLLKAALAAGLGSPLLRRRAGGVLLVTAAVGVAALFTV
ncbi:MAG: MgtC/SapB family protein [Rariglobus sp.]|nr:MgtC/SapB family protein [Rariglobus sp.]